MSADLPSETTEIGGVQYTVSMLPLKKWLQLKKVVLRTIGQALAETMASMGGGIKDLINIDIPNEAIGRGIYMLCQNSDPESDEAMLRLLSESTMIGDSRLDPIGHWPRHMENLGPYLSFAIGVQFRDFFVGLVSALPSAGQKVAR